MANNENLIPIPGRLHSVATEGHVAGANEIYDDTLSKDQETINSESAYLEDASGTAVIPSFDPQADSLHKSAQVLSAAEKAQVKQNLGIDGDLSNLNNSILAEAAARANAVSAEQSRAQAAESSLSSGKANKATSLSGYGITDAYTKTETYTKTEVNNLITTPNQEFVSVVATDQTTAVTDVLPATGAADTVYRVGNWDGSQYSEVDYTEYAWNGSAYVKLSTKSQIGEVYDISANHADTKYADLTAALGVDGANIPQSLRKGGMSVKYVQSSDNKYVQYRLMSDTFNTTPADWQGIDDEPTAGSENLVKSGGVYDKINPLEKKTEKITNIHNLTETEKIEIYDDDGTTLLHEISKDGADFKNLKTNGVDVQKKITKITEKKLPLEKKEIIYASSDYDEENNIGEKYVVIDEDGIKTKGLFGIDGNRIPTNRLVEKEGRIYKPTIIKTGGDATINNSCKSINNVQSYVIHNTSWAQIKITGFNHKVGERIGLYVYIDYSQMNKPAEQIGNMAVLTIKFRNGNTDLQSIQYQGLYELANGWNLLQSSVLNQECDSILLSPYTDSEVSFVVEAVIVGRKTKPVLTFSFDGLYQKSLDSGAYALHRQLGVPITLMGAQQYFQTDSFVNYCKGLQRDGIAEFGYYSQDVRTQNSFADALSYIDQQLSAYRKVCPNELIVVGCQHNNNSALVENACLKEGFKIFRTADLLTNDIRDVAGLRHIHTYGDYITSGWTLENQAQAITDAEAYIDALIANGDWGDIMAHQIVPFASIEADDYGLAQTYEFWEAIVTYAKNKKDNGELEIMTIGNLYNILNI